MARFLVLLPIILWLTRPERVVAFDRNATVVFLGGMLVITAAYWLVVRVALRRRDGAWGAIGVVRRCMSVAKTASVVWFALGVYQCEWAGVIGLLGMPGTALDALVATSPAYLCWALLYLGRYPVERGMWERTLLERLQNGSPVHPPPKAAGYVFNRMRVEVLFAVVPVAGVLLVRDLMQAGLDSAGVDTSTALIDAVISFGGIAVIFLIAPLILRRVLPTSSMAEGPLRDRLEAVARRTEMRFRDVLVWHTDHAVANAAVMGLFPRVRFVMLSDLLIETMTDRQIEAVFAHEIGHVRHRHMVWYVVFVGIMLLALAGPGTDLELWIRGHWMASGEVIALTIVGLTVVCFFSLFGLLSRQFERQADVFASRNVATDPDAPPVTGALVFATALRRVAQINGMAMTTPPLRLTPVGALEWLLSHANSHFHGTVQRRMDAVQRIASDTRHRRRFDYRMLAVRGLLLLLLAVGAAWLWMTL